MINDPAQNKLNVLGFFLCCKGKATTFFPVMDHTTHGTYWGMIKGYL